MGGGLIVSSVSQACRPVQFNDSMTKSDSKINNLRKVVSSRSDRNVRHSHLKGTLLCQTNEDPLKDECGLEQGVRGKVACSWVQCGRSSYKYENDPLIAKKSPPGLEGG